MVQTFQKTTEILRLLLCKVVDAPIMQVVQIVYIPVVVQRLFPVVLETVEVPQLLDMVIDAPVVQFVQFRGFFLAPCIWESLARCSVFACGVKDYGPFWETTSRMLRIQLSLVRQWVPVRRQFMMLFGRSSHVSYVQWPRIRSARWSG